MFKDGLAEALKYLETGETPAGFSAMPASPEPVADEAGAKAGKRPGSAKPRVGAPGGPGISKDAGESHARPYEPQRDSPALFWRLSC